MSENKCINACTNALIGWIIIVQHRNKNASRKRWNRNAQGYKTNNEFYVGSSVGSYWYISFYFFSLHIFSISLFNYLLYHFIWNHYPFRHLLFPSVTLCTVSKFIYFFYCYYNCSRITRCLSISRDYLNILFIGSVPGPTVQRLPGFPLNLSNFWVLSEMMTDFLN